MDIAVTGLAPLLPPGVDRGRQPRSQVEQQNRSNQQTSSENSARDSSREGQVVRGEIISRTRVDPNRVVSSTQRSLSERESALSQSGARQFSVPAAIQTFQDNEALIAPEGEKRQVSGIIDEFV